MICRPIPAATPRALILFAMTVLATDGLAASYYISPTGNDSHGCTDQAADACASFPRCNQVMKAGDTCYALGGTYTTSGLNGWSLLGTGGTASARKTFRGLPGQTAILRPTSYLGGTQDATLNLGDSALDYVTISDLTIYGRFRAGEALTDCADYVIIERIIFKCPGAMGDGNTNSIMTVNQQNEDGWTPREGWIVRDNLFTIDSTCPDYCPIAPDGPDFIHFYSMSGALIENNDFRLEDPSRSCLAPKIRFGLWFKGRSEHSRVRYNYCNGDISGCIAFNTGKCPDGFGDCNTTMTPDSDGDNRAFQNISNRSGSIGWDSNNFSGDDMVYNNTIYRPLYDGIVAAPAPSTSRSRANSSIFNNIVASHASDTLGRYQGYLRWQANTDADGICTQLYIDNNLYYPVDPGRSANFTANTAHASTLAAWRSYLAGACANLNVRETRSRTADPLFVDPSSLDFHLQATSPARAGGRGDGWPAALGAYVTGTEVIGCTFHPRCYASGATPPPTSGPPPNVIGVLRTDSY